MFEFVRDELTSFSCQITDRLLTCMKVNADIYCLHSASFQSPSKRALSLLKAGGACFITSVPSALADGIFNQPSIYHIVEPKTHPLTRVVLTSQQIDDQVCISINPSLALLRNHGCC